MKAQRLILVIGLGVVTCLSIYGSWLYTLNIMNQTFENDILKVKQSFYEGVKSAESVMQSFQSFAESAGKVDQEGFGRFASDLKLKSTFISQVSFYQYVTDEDRMNFERLLAAQGLGEVILEGGVIEGDEIIKAQTRDFYLPIAAVDTNSRDATYFGWDLMSDLSKGRMVQNLIRAKEIGATGTFLLDNGHVALEVFAPVYQNIGEGESKTFGLVSATIDLTKLLGEERWREGVTIVMTTILAGETEPKDIYRHLDREKANWPVLGHLRSEIEVHRLGQTLGLKFEKVLFPGRVNVAAVLMTILACLLLAVLALYLLTTYEKLQDSMRQLAEINATLEMKVATRTQELALAHSEMKEILDNLDDVVLTVEPNLVVGPIFSQASQRILGVETLAGQSIQELLFAKLDRHDEAASRHLFVFNMLSQMDEFQWSISSSDLLKIHQYEGIRDHSVKTLSLRYSPIFEGDQLRKLVIVASDITEILALRENLASREKEASMRELILSELANSNRSQLANFFHESDERMPIIHNFQKQFQQDSVLPLLRTLHTLKGASRTVGLKSLARQIHEVEDRLESLRVTIGQALFDESEIRNTVSKSGLVELTVQYGHYRQIFGDLFDVGNDQNRIQMMNRLELLLSSPDNERSAIASWLGLTRQEKLMSLQELFESFIPAILQLAEQTGKHVELESLVWDAFFDGRIRPLLNEALTHALRNAVDHGMESPEERVNAAKPPQGKIWLELEDWGSDQVRLTICDDGRGVNLAKVYQLARAKNLVSRPFETLSEQEVLELLFTPGFSTSDQISEISGRGVGLDAVRSSLLTYDIQCQIKSVQGSGSRFELLVPRNLVKFMVSDNAILRAVA